MSVESALKKRASVRDFSSRPVPTELIEHIFSTAIYAPSNCNVQPWNTYVVSGNAIETLRARLYGLASDGVAPDPNFDFFEGYRGKLRERQIGAAVALYGALGIKREDHEARLKAMLN